MFAIRKKNVWRKFWYEIYVFSVFSTKNICFEEVVYSINIGM